MGTNSGSDRRLQVVDHERLRHAAEVVEGVFERVQEVVGRLAVGDFAVRLPRMRQHDAKHVRATPLAIRSDDRRAGAEIDLRLMPRRAFHAPKRQRPHPTQPAQKSPHAVVAHLGRVFGHQVLMNPPRGQARDLLRLDHFAPRLAVALSATGSRLTRRSEQRFQRRRPGGQNRRIGWF